MAARRRPAPLTFPPLLCPSSTFELDWSWLALGSLLRILITYIPDKDLTICFFFLLPFCFTYIHTLYIHACILPGYFSSTCIVKEQDSNNTSRNLHKPTNKQTNRLTQTTTRKNNKHNGTNIYPHRPRRRRQQTHLFLFLLILNLILTINPAPHPFNNNSNNTTLHLQRRRRRWQHPHPLHHRLASSHYARRKRRHYPRRSP